MHSAKKFWAKISSSASMYLNAADLAFFHTWWSLNHPLSAWRPLFGPLRDYPLAVCDYSSVDPERDYELSDDVYEDFGVDENYFVYHKPGHKWYYVSDQGPTEILLFRQYDSTVGLRSGTSIPISGMFNPEQVWHIAYRHSSLCHTESD